MLPNLQRLDLPMQQRPSLFRLLERAVLMTLVLPVLCFASGQDDTTGADRKRKRLKDNAADFWIYDDLELGFEKARTSGKPLLVSFRCVP